MFRTKITILLLEVVLGLLDPLHHILVLQINLRLLDPISDQDWALTPKSSIHLKKEFLMGIHG